MEEETTVFDITDIIIDYTEDVTEEETESISNIVVVNDNSDLVDYLTLQYSVLTDISNTIHHIDTSIITLTSVVLMLWLFMIVRIKKK